MERGYIARTLAIIFAVGIGFLVSVPVGTAWITGVDSWFWLLIAVSGTSIVGLLSAFFSVVLFFTLIGLVGIVVYGWEDFEKIFDDIEAFFERFEDGTKRK